MEHALAVSQVNPILLAAENAVAADSYLLGSAMSVTADPPDQTEQRQAKTYHERVTYASFLGQPLVLVQTRTASVDDTEVAASVVSASTHYYRGMAELGNEVAQT